MKILVHDYGRHAFPVQLSRELARRGHQVLHLYAGYNNTPMGNLERQPADPPGFDARPIYTRQPLQKYSFLKRWLQEVEYGRLLAKEIAAFQPQVVISGTTPLDAQRYAFFASRKQKARFIFWLQDVNGIAAYSLLKRKIPVVGAWIGRYHIALERYMLRNSQRVILIAEDFRKIVTGWQVDQAKIAVIPNWAPVEEIPVLEKDNLWAQEHDLADKLCFLYSGSLGMKHNPDLLLQLAQSQVENSQVRVVVASEGLGAAWLAQKKAELKVENLLLLGYQPFERLPEMLASADILLSVLEPDAGIFSVPSKVLTYLCAQRPILLAIPDDNQAAKMVCQNQAGIVVPPNDTHAFVQAAQALLNDPGLRMKMAVNGRSFAEQNFNVQTIGARFEELF